MGSKIIGRTGCPECGFESAHVKRSDKCLYRYCPECGSQHMARSQRQEADLMAKTRPVDAPAPAPSGSAEASPAPEPVAVAVAPAVPAAPPPPATPKRRGLFG